MLKLNDQDFTTGRATFLDRLPADAEASAKIYVKLRPADLDTTILAQLDTGSPWSILDPEVAQAVGVLDESGEPKRLRAHGNIYEGQLVRLPVLILADEGDSLQVDATVFVCREWPVGKSFVGYTGLLETIRIALDAQRNHVYFGPAGAPDAV